MPGLYVTANLYRPKKDDTVWRWPIGFFDIHIDRLLELNRMIAEQGVKPALVVGMPVGFVSAAESKDLIASQHEVPWLVIRGRKGGSTLVVAAIHAMLSLAEAAQKKAA